MSGRQLQLFLLKEQIEDLLRPGHVEVIPDGRLGSLEPGARQRLRCLDPLDDSHLGLFSRFLLGSLEVGDWPPRLFCIQVRMEVFIGRYLRQEVVDGVEIRQPVDALGDSGEATVSEFCQVPL